MANIPEEVRRFARTLSRKNVTLDTSLNDEKPFKRLIQLGIFHPYGDSFLYNGKAFFICGSTGTGKSPLVKRLRERFGPKIRPLVQDNPILYWNGNSKPVTYADCAEHYPQLFLDPFLTPENHTPYELEGIILLREGSQRGVSPLSIDGQRELYGFLIETYNVNLDSKNKTILDNVLRQVSCAEYNKDYGYPNNQALEEATRDIALHVGVPKKEVEQAL